MLPTSQSATYFKIEATKEVILIEVKRNCKTNIAYQLMLPDLTLDIVFFKLLNLFLKLTFVISAGAFFRRI